MAETIKRYRFCFWTTILIVVTFVNCCFSKSYENNLLEIPDSRSYEDNWRAYDHTPQRHGIPESHRKHISEFFDKIDVEISVEHTAERGSADESKEAVSLPSSRGKKKLAESPQPNSTPLSKLFLPPKESKPLIPMTAIVIGSLFGLLVVVSVGYFMLRRKRAERLRKESFFENNRETHSLTVNFRPIETNTFLLENTD